MIPPNAVRLIIRHLDSLDRAVSRRMHRKRPWLEPALTSLLCDLLDSTTQDDEKLDYPIGDLNRDLKNLDGLLSTTFSVETHEYPPQLERWVTQADIGLVINIIDHLLPDHSRTFAWLLQAKRLTPDFHDPENIYSESSRFGGIDSDQKERMKRLAELVGVPFIQYLLYCPRPCFLHELIKKKLAHLRNSSLTENIFDYSLGLILHDELGLAESSLAAGIFVSVIEDLEQAPKNLAQVHLTMLEVCYPLSWFLAGHLVENDRFALGIRSPISPIYRKRRRLPQNQVANDANEEWARGIVTGDPDAIDRLLTVGGDISNGPFPVLPPHTLTINIEIGGDLPPELRQIRQG